MPDDLGAKQSELCIRLYTEFRTANDAMPIGGRFMPYHWRNLPNPLGIISMPYAHMLTSMPVSSPTLSTTSPTTSIDSAPRRRSLVCGEDVGLIACTFLAYDAKANQWDQSGRRLKRNREILIPLRETRSGRGAAIWSETADVAHA